MAEIQAATRLGGAIEPHELAELEWFGILGIEEREGELVGEIHAYEVPTHIEAALDWIVRAGVPPLLVAPLFEEDAYGIAGEEDLLFFQTHRSSAASCTWARGASS